MDAFLRTIRDLALLVLRLALGAGLILRGWQRWRGGMDHQIAILDAASIPAPDKLAWLVVAFEVAGGICLLFGLATPLVALGVIVLNVGIGVLHRWQAGWALNEGGYEYQALTAAVGLILLTFGSGRLGMDVMFRRPPDEREPGTLIDDRGGPQDSHSEPKADTHREPSQ